MTSQELKDKQKDNPIYPFTTPDNYFEDFKDRLMLRIAAEETVLQTSAKTSTQASAKRQPSRTRRIFFYVAGIAAILIGLAVVFNLINVPTSGLNQQELMDLRAEDAVDEQFHQFLLDETTEDYWGTILMEETNDIDNTLSAR
ncbi:MAG: hypothetical protein Q4E10_00930 [Porphyromonas sp.]|nr:hypothetical protein [Porphyromonas sp.]